MSMPEPPPPLHILRGHTSSITALYVTSDNERIYSGDASGHANCTSTQTLRPILSWNPHDDGILGVEEYGQAIVTQGRDNKLHVWQRAEEVSKIGGSAALAESRTPTLRYSLDVNALNYCRFSLFVQGSTSEEDESLLAVPNLVESSEADIWRLPSCQRIHAAIGKEKGKGPILSTDGRGAASNGIIMSLHLFAREDILHILIAYENGTVTLRTSGRAKSVEGLGWEVVWSVKLHVEAIMAMTVSLDHTMAYTVSADHLVGRYNLLVPESQSFRIKQAGNSSITVRDDGKVCAVGGWDGKIRLFSTKTFKPLGTLKYHKEGCQAVTFTRLNPRKLPSVDEDEEDDLDESEKEERARWLVAGAKDKLISIWSLISFQRSN